VARVDNGDLVITVFRFANIGEEVAGLKQGLADPETGLSLPGALNLVEYKEKEDNSMLLDALLNLGELACWFVCIPGCRYISTV
jgi:hypothetical protein